MLLFTTSLAMQTRMATAEEKQGLNVADSGGKVYKSLEKDY